MKSALNIVKIGGNIINNEILLNRFLEDFSKMRSPKILVHGGGKSASDLALKLGLKPTMINGRRVTNKQDLEVVTMVYAGLLNKSIVAQLQSHQCDAIGLTGADANSILAHKRIVKEVDYGLAGDIDLINTSRIVFLLKGDLTPVFCAITHNKSGQLLNTNADTIAAELAIGLASAFQVNLYYCFEKKGVLENVDDENSVIKHIDAKKYQELKNNKIIFEGMLPKLNNCFNALEKGVDKVMIGDNQMILDNSNLHSILTL